MDATRALPDYSRMLKVPRSISNDGKVARTFIMTAIAEAPTGSTHVPPYSVFLSGKRPVRATALIRLRITPTRDAGNGVARRPADWAHEAQPRKSCA